METSSCSQVPLQDGSQKEMCKSWGREGVSRVSEGEVGQYLSCVGWKITVDTLDYF